MTSISLSIDKKFFDENKAKWLEQGETDGYEVPTYSINVGDLSHDEATIEDGDIHYMGISDENNNINLSTTLDMDLDLVGEILEMYIKKVNKIKTIIEATK